MKLRAAKDMFLAPKHRYGCDLGHDIQRHEALNHATISKRGMCGRSQEPLLPLFACSTCRNEGATGGRSPGASLPGCPFHRPVLTPTYTPQPSKQGQGSVFACSKSSNFETTGPEITSLCIREVSAAELVYRKLRVFGLEFWVWGLGFWV